MKLQKVIAHNLLKRSLVSYLLYPSSLLYSQILQIRRNYLHLIFKPYQSPVFIISIGNIVSGGTGKTPFTIFLARELLRQGLKAAISHRGYKSGNDDVPRLISDRDTILHDVQVAGDEACLTAESLPGIPVVTGRNRRAAIELLVNAFPDLDCIILDDSFQHLNVHHDLDIVIMHEQTGFGNGFVLPAGYLREPVGALHKADIIITNRNSTKADIGFQQKLKSYCSLVYSGMSRPGKIYDIQGKIIDAESLTGKRILLVSAIGNPAGFAQTARELGLDVVEKVEYPDHYDYKDLAGWRSLVQRSKALQVDYCLTTEKDYAKIRHLPLHGLSLLILPVSFMLDKESDNLISKIMQKIQNHRKQN